MFFSKLKKSEKPKKGLPENLAVLQDSPDTVWVWDPDYKMLVWANDIGMEFWNAKNRIELKELVFPPFHPMMQINDEAIRQTKKKGSFVTGLTLVTYPEEIIFDCHFTIQTLPDGREGLLVRIPADAKNTAEKSETVISQNDNDDDSDLASLESSDEEITVEDIETDEDNTPTTTSILTDDTIFTTPFTISVHENGYLMGADERTNFYIQANEKTKFTDLFTNKKDAESIILEALQVEQGSFIARLTIQEQDLPFLLQTFSLMHEGSRIINVAMLRITDEQYNDHMTTIADATEVNNVHENETIAPDTDTATTAHSDNNVEDVIIEEVSETLPKSVTQETDITEDPPKKIVTDSATTAMFDTDPDGLIRDCNNMSKTLTGLYKDDLLGRHIQGLFDEVTAQNITDFIQNNTTNTGEYADGKPCQFHGEGNKAYDGILVIRKLASNIGGFLFLLDDHSEINALKKDIHSLKEEASKDHHISKTDVLTHSAESQNIIAADKSQPSQQLSPSQHVVPDYLAHISHELRAPLNAISGYTELLTSEVFGAIDPRYKEYLAALNTASSHAKEVVNDLLDYAKLEAGGFKPNIIHTDLGAIMRDALILVKPQADFKNIDIQEKILTGTPPIKADPRLLKQVLCNILSNAIKYSDENENIYLAAGLTKTNRLMIEVTNFGVGMTEEQIQIVLEPYGRLAKDQNIQGTGLGIPLAKKLTELMDAHFLIHSIPNEKTRVRLIFDQNKIVTTTV